MLSGLVAAEDVAAEDGVYRLTERLVRRQRRVALRKGMIDLRLAELREGRLTIASQGRAPTAYSATQRPHSGHMIRRSRVPILKFIR